MLCQPLRLRLVDDAAPEEVPDVRCERVDLRTVRVKCEREELTVLDPEVPVEPFFQIGRLLLQLIGERRITPDRTREAGGTIFASYAYPCSSQVARGKPASRPSW